MSITELDNPAWFSLNGAHQHLAIGGDLAKRYPSDIFKWAAVEEQTGEAFQELARFVDVGEEIIVAAEDTADNSLWEIIHKPSVIQMVCTRPIDVPEHDVEIQPLTATDVPDMMALVELTKPGPFAERTIELGFYHGIRQNHKLIAMAGSRIWTPHYCEISAVCTHPEYRGKGYGSLLTKILSHKFQKNGLIPYLIVVHSKVEAKRLYEKLGFEVHQKLHGILIRRCPD